MQKFTQKTLITTLLSLCATASFAAISTVTTSTPITAAGQNQVIDAVNTLSTTVGSGTLPSGYGSDLTSAISTIVNGNSTFTNTGLLGAADHVYYVSSTSLGSQDLGAFINGLPSTSSDLIVVRLAPGIYTLTNSITARDNLTIQGTSAQNTPSSVINAQANSIGLGNNNILRNLTITSTASNAITISGSGLLDTIKDSSVNTSGTTAINVASSGGTNILTIDDSTIAGATNAIATSSNATATLNININNNSTTTGLITANTSAGTYTYTLTANSSALSIASGLTITTSGGATTPTVQLNNSQLGNINAPSIVFTLLQAVSSQLGNLNVAANSVIVMRNSVAGTLGSTPSASSIFVYSGLNSSSKPSGTNCFSSYNTNNYSLLSGCT